ncbi:Competence protein ComEA, helix-hairpin-helix repeat region [Edwardsiella anguillarum]|uniref:ComEA family DNA-binding protein n=1 Tax=Edwardsiella TaxID=635 RepID=UPI00045CC668|nr:ComEA family DNA-binding protein [Edwardsiella anguillarum]AKM48463.1 hypothetical protein QY76_15200 [Edwardsiella sp. EA181011]GAJ67706.1 competence protein ComEA, helix-hairpin-helix repeat region [Edwardsiella piscicida]RFS99592.1 competence protein [Edwardsiella anguillarum]BET80227.1 Competence protein ComEA, helix-hairpin-helix repeat region [Edwardsiella anguillarum]BET83516.1 Competence protein ComEA, helix-hairpin-helix repeat region [Edwardsiella anguillarum]
MNPLTLLLSSPLWIALLFFPAAPAAAPPAGPVTHSGGGAARAERGQVNINQASAQALSEGLSGIGLEKARAIVAFREQHGAFSRLEQLLQVKGIGAALLEKNRARLAL